MNSFKIKGAASVLAAIAFIFGVNASTSATFAQNVAAPPTYTVDRTDDATVSNCTTAANDCTLRGAITSANTLATGATVNFDATLFATAQTIDLPNGQLTISRSMTITGTTADKLRIRNTKAPSLTSRVFFINSGITVSLSGMTITGGKLSGDSGGGIFNYGTTTITNCVISDNSTTSYGGGIYNDIGSLTLLNSTVSGNTANGANGGGGGIDHEGGTMTITNSTISGNSETNTANNNGGGILAYANMTVTNSTITNNSVGGSVGASGISLGSGTVTLLNTIVAGNVNNTTVPDLSGAFVSSGNNLIGNPGTATGLVASDLKGTAATPLDPRLSPLGDYGGGTLSHALLQAGTSPASPAIDAGKATGAPAADQRGATRTAPVDIGAYEVNSSFVAVLPSAKVGVAYNQTITPESGSFVYTISSATQPPPGTTLTGGGIILSAPSFAKSGGKFDENGAPLAPAVGSYQITGTPTTAGTYPFTITATNTANSFSVNYSITVLSAPTAASVSISGRVLTPTGRGLINAVVTLTDSNGETRSTRTTAFGYYRFDEAAAGETYIISVRAKRYQFAAQVVSINEDTASLNFTANESGAIVP